MRRLTRMMIANLQLLIGNPCNKNARAFRPAVFRRCCWQDKGRFLCGATICLLASLVSLPSISAEMLPGINPQAGDSQEAAPQDSAAQASTPPWLLNDQDQLPTVAQITPADALVGIERSEIDRLIDGRPLDLNDETLLRLLYRVPQMNLESVHRFVNETEGIDLNDVIAAPDLFRLSMFRMRGTALYIERILIEPEMAELFELTHYFRVLFREQATHRVVWMVTPTVPSGWPLEQPIAETTGFDGLLLMTISDDAPQGLATDVFAAPLATEGDRESEVDAAANDALSPEVQLPQGSPLYVARRLEWFPVSAHLHSELPLGWRWLSARGMDASLWDTMVDRDRQPLGDADSECFYQALAALSRQPQDAIVSAACRSVATAAQYESTSAETPDALDIVQHGTLESFPLFELLKSPADFRGERLRLSGNVRRITRIEIDRAYFSDRLDLNHYYQLDLFVKLEPNQVVRMSTTDGSPGPEFRGKYPVTLCVTRLPKGLEPTDDINRQVTVEAHFFKIWAYPSRYVEQYDPEIRQLGPLFVARDLEMNESSAQPVALTIIAGVVLAVSLGGAWLGAWALGRREARPVTASSPSQAGADPEFLKRLSEDDRAGKLD